MVDSLFNKNDNFDYSGFTNLAYAINSGEIVTTYVHTFTTQCTYLFMNSLDNHQQTIIKVAAETSTCSTSNSVSLYSLNLKTSTSLETGKVNMSFFFKLVGAKIDLLVLLVFSVTYTHSLDKNWTIFPCPRT